MADKGVCGWGGRPGGCGVVIGRARGGGETVEKSGRVLFLQVVTATAAGWFLTID